MEVNLCVSSFGCLYPFLVLVIFFEYLITPLNLWYEMVLYALMIKDRSLLLKRNEGEWGSSMSFSSIVLTFQEVSNDDTRGCLCWKLYVYLCFSSFNEAVAKHIDSNLQVQRHFACSPSFKSLQDFSYCHNGLGISFSVIFIIDLFVLSSNTVALKVISESALNRCIVACFCAHAVKLLVTQISTQRSLRF
eukprot:XP_024450433.1 uncharacterized protein LOC18096405 [Populus trichocarpa]